MAAPTLNHDGVSVKGCTAIYAPKGQAGEYAPLAANPYRGCGHRCAYCYVPLATAAGMLKRIGCPCCGELKKLYPASQDQIPEELKPVVGQAGGGGD